MEQLAIATYNPSNGSQTDFVVYDRDFSGTNIDQHGKAGDGGFNVMPSYSKITNFKYGLTTTYLTGAFPFEGTSPAAPTFDMARTDGYQVGELTLQGLRAYDPALEQWTTPDGTTGSPDSPSTQWSYAWNAGNPVTNQDPNGSTVCVYGQLLNEIVDYMYANSPTFAYIFSELAMSSTTYTFIIAPILSRQGQWLNDGGIFDPQSNAIILNPVFVAPFQFFYPLTMDSIVNLLAHEIGHAADSYNGTLVTHQGEAFGPNPASDNMAEEYATGVWLVIMCQLIVNGYNPTTLDQYFATMAVVAQGEQDTRIVQWLDSNNPFMMIGADSMSVEDFEDAIDDM